MKGGEGPFNYKLEDAADWLQDFFQDDNNNDGDQKKGG